jgi:selenide,water dikinase
MKTAVPLTRDLVLIGGGHTHALVLRMWAMNPLPGVRVTLINPEPTAAYSGMLPGFVAGHFTRADLDIDLVRLARFAGARLILGAAVAIDSVKREIKVPGRPAVAYDVASVDIGITSHMPSLPGFDAHATPAKPLAPFATAWDRFRAGAQDPHLAIIGGGVAGVELALAMTHALRGDGHKPVMQLIDRGPVLKALGTSARRKACAALAAAGVSVISDSEVAAVTAKGVTLADGHTLRADFVTGAAGAKPYDWVSSETELETKGGFITVNAALQSSDPAVFAVGDCAHMTEYPRPKAGVFAVRQAPVLFDNLCAALSGGAMRAYRPQRDYLKLISLGGQTALAEKFGIGVQGPQLWRLKTHIDQKFMRKFTDFPQMPQPKTPAIAAHGVKDAMAGQPLCGGCGAKVGRGALLQVLDDLPEPARDDIRPLPGDDAALLQMGEVKQVLTTDHLRAFSHDPVMMARIAATHALGDIWAMGAEPQAATVNLVLPRLAAPLQARTLSEITQAAHEVLSHAGAAIVGGHTSVGDELTIGFSLTGLLSQAPLTLAGAQAGDMLILTKPLGSGVLMAAEMQMKAQGVDIAGALVLMTQSQARASEILRDEAHAMTDVTGFGLAGHLAGMCAASGLSAEIDLDATPFMPGARALSARGIRSSLFPANRSGAGVVLGTSGAAADVLFDPQTAGGLLAAVPQAVCLEKLCDAGYQAAIIGRMVAGDPMIRIS